MKESKHYTDERGKREWLIANVIHEGKVLHTCRISDREIHKVTDTGIIIVINPIKRRVITKLIARKNQILRDFPEAPEAVLAKASYHEKRGWHHCK